jgi:hypothetical protein
MSVEKMRLYQFSIIASLRMAITFAAAAELPDAIVVKGETVVLHVQARGAQIEVDPEGETAGAAC